MARKLVFSFSERRLPPLLLPQAFFVAVRRGKYCNGMLVVQKWGNFQFSQERVAMSRRLPSVLGILLALAVPAAAQEPAKNIRQKLYITNSQGDDVTVVDLATNKPIGRIVVGPHPHGIAAPKSQDFILITIEGGKVGELVWIDPHTDKVIKRMECGPAPNALAVTPDGKFAYVPCSNGSFEVIDLAQMKIVERIRTGGRPHNTVCSADGKHMYLAPMGDIKKVLIADTSTHKVVGEIPFGDVVRPIAISADEKHIFAQVDGLVGFEMADIAERKVIHRVADTLTEEQKKVPSRSHGVGVRPDQKELWECDLAHSTVHVFDLTGAKPEQVAAIPMGGHVYWLTFSADGKFCYVSVLSKNEAAVVDTDTKQIVARIPAGKEPKRLLAITVPER
jgi:YVTN family beta-propeller protein